MKSESVNKLDPSVSESSSSSESRQYISSNFLSDSDSLSDFSVSSAGSSPPSSGPSNGYSSNDDSDDDMVPEDYEELFQHIDVDNLLFTRGIISLYLLGNINSVVDLEISPSLQLGIMLITWKSQMNVSTEAYKRLRLVLQKCHIKVSSFKSVVRELVKIVGFSPVNIDCCINRCIAFTGRYRNATRCPECNHHRYQDLEAEGDVHDTDPEDSENEHDAPFEQVFARPQPVCNIVICNSLSILKY